LLNKYLLTAIKVFNDSSRQASLDAYEIEGLPVTFQDEDFENHYGDFLAELQGIALRTRDIDIVYDYITGSLSDVLNWNGFTFEQYKIIFTAGHEVNYLINLKRNIEKYVENIQDYCKRDNYGEISEELIEFYERTIAGLSPVKDPAFQNSSHLLRKSDFENEHSFLDRFNLARLKVECEKLPDTLTKIKFMQDQLYDYRQLEIEAKKDVSLKKIVSNSHNFEKLCTIELERLHKRLELEQKYPHHILPGSPTLSESFFAWNGSDAELMELVAALCKSETIKRSDGKKTTFDELLQLFEKMFNYQLKGPRTLQPNSMELDKSLTPFLDNLIDAFEAYSLEMDENKSKLN